jgi:hypothetical protein
LAEPRSYRRSDDFKIRLRASRYGGQVQFPRFALRRTRPVPALRATADKSSSRASCYGGQVQFPRFALRRTGRHPTPDTRHPIPDTRYPTSASALRRTSPVPALRATADTPYLIFTDVWKRLKS